MNDRVFQGFLQGQHDEGMALAAASDVLTLTPLGAGLADRFVATFQCRGLVRLERGEGPAGAANAAGAAGGTGAEGRVIAEADRFDIGVWFAPEHLRRVDPPRVITWLSPLHIFHPNIRPPFLCAGRVPPGVGLVELLYQIYEIITYQKVTMREDDALNHEACAWARANQDRFPIDRRPLKRRASSAAASGARPKARP